MAKDIYHFEINGNEYAAEIEQKTYTIGQKKGDKWVLKKQGPCIDRNHGWRIVGHWEHWTRKHEDNPNMDCFEVPGFAVL